MPSIAVVGAGPGLGLAIARTFGSQGYNVGLSRATAANSTRSSTGWGPTTSVPRRSPRMFSTAHHSPGHCTTQPNTSAALTCSNTRRPAARRTQR